MKIATWTLLSTTALSAGCSGPSFDLDIESAAVTCTMGAASATTRVRFESPR
jgi:hypothetical protein